MFVLSDIDIHGCRFRSAKKLLQGCGMWVRSAFGLESVAYMHFQKIFSPTLLQPCPCCGQVIDVSALRKVENARASRWYESSTPFRTACPKCAGFVKFNIENSPWFAVALLLLFAGIASSILWPQVGIFMQSVSGRLVGILIVVLLVWLAIKQSKLVRDL